MKRFMVLFLVCFLLFATLTVTANAAEVDVISDDMVKENNNQNTNSQLPSFYNSVDLGFSSPIKKQQGNICWAYSANSLLESYLLKHFNFATELNVPLMDSWATPDENGEGWQREPYSSGYGYIPTGYFTSWTGAFDSNEEKLPYGVTAIRYLDKGEDTLIKEAIMKNGAVAADYNSESTAYSKNNTSFCLTDPISVMSGHSINVVGWDDNYSKDNFDGNYRPKENGAWLCKNSWGDYNELGGYFWISYEDYYLFNDEIFATSYTIEQIQEINEKDSIYQNEIYGATYEFNYIIGENLTYFSMFDFSEQGNVIDKIIFESTSTGAIYNVYYVPAENDVPVSDKTKWYKLDSGTIDYRGYICCDIENLIVSQAKGAIAIEIDTSALNEGLDDTDDNYTPNGIGVCEWLRKKGTTEMIFTQQSSAGECFVTFNDSIIDLYDFYNSEEILNDPVGGTFVIKAITNDTIDTKIKGDLNFDENLDINDATYLQQYLVNYIPKLMEDQRINGDFNNDGQLDIRDVTAIQKHLVGLE